MKHQPDQISWMKAGDRWAGTLGGYRITIRPEAKFREWLHRLGLDLPMTYSFLTEIHHWGHTEAICEFSMRNIRKAISEAVKMIEYEEEERIQRESAIRQGWEKLDGEMGTLQADPDQTDPDQAGPNQAGPDQAGP